jgi:phosphoglycerol transferase MdoB-like AlkP superfamily enzyme
MVQQRYVSKVVSVLGFYFLVVILFTLYRCLLLIMQPVSTSNITDLLITGFRFDNRWASLLTFPLVLICIIQEIVTKRNHSYPVKWYARVVLLSLVLFFLLDYFYFQYTGTRLSPVVLELITPLPVAAKLVWQSYPVIWLLFLVIACIWLFDVLVIKRLFAVDPLMISHKKTILYLVLLLLFFGISSWGTFKKYPLTWSEAFHEPANGVLALNPAESFFYSLFYKEISTADPTQSEYKMLEATIKHDSIRAQQKGVIKEKMATRGEPLNIVILLAESLSTYKTSLSDKQPLQPTPFLKSLTDSSYYFSNCFTPHFGTARAVWNLFTGLPDVNWKKLATHQIPSAPVPVLLNQLPFAEKFYMLGGDGTWADINGFLKSNVKDIKVIDAEQMKSKSASAWGADDYDLLMQADEQFRNSRAPFFAVIQTASNHQPFIIPATAQQRGFVQIKKSVDSLKNFGFADNKEYNSMRYMDFCLQSFFKQAAASDYFSNTLFIIVGDHGTTGNALNSFSADWNTYKLKLLHVPLVFYKPGVQLSFNDSSLCSLQDIIPTVYGLQQQQTIQGLRGVDLFSGSYKTGQFYMLHELHQLGWIAPEIRFLASYTNNELKHVVTNEPFVQDSIGALVMAAYKVSAKNKK